MQASPDMVSFEGAGPGEGYTQIMPCLTHADNAVAHVRPVSFWPAEICTQHAVS